MLICILTKNVITSCSVTMMLFLHLEVKPLMTLTTVLYLSCALISGHLAMMLMELTDRKSGSAGMPRPSSYAVFCVKRKSASQPRCGADGSGRRLRQRRLSVAEPEQQPAVLFAFSDPANPEIYTLSLHDALPIYLL